MTRFVAPRYLVMPFVLMLIMMSSAKATVKFGSITVDEMDNLHYLSYVRWMTVPKASQTGTTWDLGNDVSNKSPEEIEDIVADIRDLEVPLNRLIFDSMYSSDSETFQYATASEARDAVMMRIKVVEKVHEMNTAGFYDYPIVPGDVHTNANKWEKGKETSFYFKQVAGTAYEAIHQICDPNISTCGDCLGAAYACIWWGSSEAIGATAFNTKHPGTDALDMAAGVGNHRYTAVDTSTPIPGDWLYMRNYNYREVIHTPEFFKDRHPDDSWLIDGHMYLWSGENAFCVGVNSNGELLYEGLGVPISTEDGLRNECKTAYNRDLAAVISHHGQVGSVEVTAITDGNKEARITFLPSYFFRVQN